MAKNIRRDRRRITSEMMKWFVIKTKGRKRVYFRCKFILRADIKVILTYPAIIVYRGHYNHFYEEFRVIEYSGE